MRQTLVRQWLLIKVMPPTTRMGLAGQALLWTLLTLLLLWGVVGLVYAPFS